MRFFITLAIIGCLSIPARCQSYKSARELVTEVSRQLLPPQPVTYIFTAQNKRFGHFSRPWKTEQYLSSGAFCMTPSDMGLYIQDSIAAAEKYYRSITCYTDDMYALKYAGSNSWAAPDTDDKALFLRQAAAYNPVYILQDFLRQPETSFLNHTRGIKDTITYARNAEEHISIIIDRDAKTVAMIRILFADDVYGDVATHLYYNDYKRKGDIRYPALVRKMQHDTVITQMQIHASNMLLDVKNLYADLPAGYALKPPQAMTPSVVHTQYNEYIHLLDLPHTSERSLVVNFKDFLLVAAAPLSTENGTLILDKLKELFPGKQVRYFVAGHHHPHYLGGVRAFIHMGATVLSVPGNMQYIRQLAAFTHSLKPDILEKEPKDLLLETIGGEKEIDDGNVTMRIIHIGDESQHTTDYLVYYFPQYRILFEDDLAWIAQDKPLAKAGARQKGLYDAIMKHGLTVDTVIQGWPTDGYGVKTIIPFSELEQTALMK